MYLVKPHNPLVLTSYTNKKAIYCSRCNTLTVPPAPQCDHFSLFKGSQTVVVSVQYTQADLLRLRRKYGRRS